MDEKQDQFSEGFNRLLSKLEDSGQLNWLFMTFDKLKSDSARIGFVHELEGIDKLLDTSNIPKLRKSSKISEQKRNEGNKFFQKGQYEKALSEYNDSLAYACPHCDDQDGKSYVALALANRSAALFHLKKHEDCLRDIEDALKAGYPEDLQYKLYGRRGQCYQALKLNSEAKDAFEVAKGLLDKAKLESEKKYTMYKDTQKNIDACNKSQSSKRSNLPNEKTNLPKVSDGPNATHASLTAACKVAFSAEKGRYVVANRDIRPGEVILVEKPYASVLHAEQENSMCHHCLMSCIAPVPCQHCPMARYCSRTCRDASWDSYHKYECDILHIIYKTGLGAKYHLALRIVIVAGLDFLLGLREEKSKSTTQETNAGEMKGCNAGGQYVAGDYSTVDHLLSHDGDHATESLACMSARAVFLAKLLEKSEFFTPVSPEERSEVVTYISELILGHVKRIECSILEMFNMKSYNAMMASFQYKLFGHGLHTTYNLFNNSCSPNTSQHFHGNQCFVLALSTIKKGEEVSVTYGWRHDTHPRVARQFVLLKCYHFLCSCEACSNFWPEQKCHHDRIPTPTFKCAKCSSPLPKTTGDTEPCLKCSTVENLQTKRKIFETSQIVLGECICKVQQGTVYTREALPMLLKSKETLDKLLALPHPSHFICQAIIKMCFSSMYD